MTPQNPADAPAFPQSPQNNPMIADFAPKGLTKREYFAGLLLQGNFANPAYFGYKLPDLIEGAIEGADALLKALARETEG